MSFPVVWVRLRKCRLFTLWYPSIVKVFVEFGQQDNVNLVDVALQKCFRPTGACQNAMSCCLCRGNINHLKKNLFIFFCVKLMQTQIANSVFSHQNSSMSTASEALLALWLSSYEMESGNRVQILKETVCISLFISLYITFHFAFHFALHFLSCRLRL